jgi:membrane-bound serine protease (ClpP class)
LLQTPGWLAAAAIAFALGVWVGLPAWIGVALVAVWIAKDLALYPAMKHAYERSERNGPGEALVGSRGVVTQDLDLDGWVSVHGSLWQARAEQRIERGRRVTVEAVDGLCLVVRPEP